MDVYSNMNETFKIKYRKLLEILPDVAQCAGEKLVLVGGTALSLFYFNHRLSIDLDFVPIEGDETMHKEMLKGCLSKKGYRTIIGAFKNQFIIQFEDVSTKIEIFKPNQKIKKVEKKIFGGTELLVASLEDILKMKIDAYKERKEARDAFDIYFILKSKEESLDELYSLLRKFGKPKNIELLSLLVLDKNEIKLFKKVVDDASS